MAAPVAATQRGAGQESAEAIIFTVNEEGPNTEKARSPHEFA